LSALESSKEPSNYEETKHQLVWITAMKEELQTLDKNHTQDVVRLPDGKRLVGCRWIYKIKYYSDGSIERYEACLVATALITRRHLLQL